MPDEDQLISAACQAERAVAVPFLTSHRIAHRGINSTALTVA